MTDKERFSVVGDLHADSKTRDVSHVYQNHSDRGLQDDEKLALNWRVISNETGRTMCAFAGGAGKEAAEVFRDHCEKHF